MNATFGAILAGSALAGSVMLLGSLFELELNESRGLSSDIKPSEQMAVKRSVSSNAPQSYIVHSNNFEKVVEEVQAIGGQVANTYPIINAVNAKLTTEQYQQLSTTKDLTVSLDTGMMTSDINTPLKASYVRNEY